MIAATSLFFVTGCGSMNDPVFWTASLEASPGYPPSDVQPEAVASPGLVPPRSITVPAAGADLVTLLEGCVIIANDGQFLGRITRNEVTHDSILNEVGRYGSEVSPTSIFNQVGRYGSEVSPLSAFNEIASTPPRIVNQSGRVVAYLTVNPIKTPAVDPRILIGLLRSER